MEAKVLHVGLHELRIYIILSMSSKYRAVSVNFSLTPTPLRSYLLLLYILKFLPGSGYNPHTSRSPPSDVLLFVRLPFYHYLCCRIAVRSSPNGFLIQTIYTRSTPHILQSLCLACAELSGKNFNVRAKAIWMQYISLIIKSFKNVVIMCLSSSFVFIWTKMICHKMEENA